MSFSGGTFSLASGNPVTTGTTISSTWANNTLSDIATGLSTCVLKDGTQTITANIPMSSFKFTGLAAGSAAGDSLRYEQLFTTGSVNLLGSLFVPSTVSASGAFNWNQAAVITATATVALGAATGNYAVVTGTATVSSFDSIRAGALRIVEWSGTTPISASSNMLTPSSNSILTAAGDTSIVISEGAGTWRFISHSGFGVPTGAVMPFAGTTAPNNWLLCYGQAISRTTYAGLFAVISTTYGVGDGSTTFNVPDLRGRVVAGQDDMGGSSANRLTGLSGGVDGDVLAAAGGEEAHVLTTTEMPAHTHTQNLGPNTGGASALNGQATSITGTQTSSSTGNDGAHNNVQPTLILNYIIKT